MTKFTTEARPRTTTKWIANHVRKERGCRPPVGSGLRRRQLRCVRKEVASRSYQLLSGHALIGSYLRDKIHNTDNNECWW